MPGQGRFRLQGSRGLGLQSRCNEGSRSRASISGCFFFFFVGGGGSLIVTDSFLYLGLDFRVLLVEGSLTGLRVSGIIAI